MRSPSALRRRLRNLAVVVALIVAAACLPFVAREVQAAPSRGRPFARPAARPVRSAPPTSAPATSAPPPTFPPPPPATPPAPASAPFVPDDSCRPQPKASGGTWQCTLDEEFNGTSLNRNLWIPQQTSNSGFHSGPECLVDSPDNVSVGNGVLTLTVRKEPRPFVCPSPKGSFTTQYTGGQVSTYQRFSQAYGRFEVRASFPDNGAAGVQTALWMWPDAPRRDRWEEIDIAEFFSTFANRVIPFVHYENHTNVTNDDCLVADAGRFHTYAVEWTPVSLTFIYDGRTCLLHRLQPTSYGRAFDKPFIIALSQVLGITNNSFDPAHTPLPASAEIDYVRVWK